jgi:hypothetical protein
MYVGINVFREHFTIPTYRNINLSLYLRIGHNQFDLSATGDIKPISPIYQQDALASSLFFIYNPLTATMMTGTSSAFEG